MDAGNWITLFGIGLTLLIAVIGYQWRLSQRVTKAEAHLVPGVNEKLATLSQKIDDLDRKQDQDRVETARKMEELRGEISASEKRTEKALDKLDGSVARIHDRLDQIIGLLPPPPSALRRARSKP